MILFIIFTICLLTIGPVNKDTQAHSHSPETDKTSEIKLGKVGDFCETTFECPKVQIGSVLDELRVSWVVPAGIIVLCCQGPVTCHRVRCLISHIESPDVMAELRYHWLMGHGFNQ